MSNRKLILHIGMPKTGSTSLQVFFAQNIAKLAAHNIYYPEIFDLSVSKRGSYGQGNGYSLAYALLDDKSTTVCNFPAYGLVDLDQTLAMMEEKSSVLLSTEWFTELSEDALTKLRDVGLKHGFTFTIIGYIRPYISFLNSEYAQGVKIGRIKLRADNWVWTHSFKDVVDRFRRIFGHQSLALRPFAKPSWVNGSLYADFLSMVGVDHDGWADFVIGEEQNQALTPEVVNIQLGMNILGASFTQDDLMVIDQVLRATRRVTIARGLWFSPRKLDAIKVKLRPEVDYLTSNYFPGNNFLLNEFNDDATVAEAMSLNDVRLTPMEERDLFEQACKRILHAGVRGAEERARRLADKANLRLVDIVLKADLD